MNWFKPKSPDQKNGFLDFSTTTSAHGSRAVGVGVFEGRVPKEIEGVTFDGSPVNFTNPATLERIIEASRAAEELKRRNITVDCFGFVALFADAINTEQLPNGSKKWMDYDYDDEEVATGDITDGSAYAIGVSHYDNRLTIEHAVIAAETDLQMLFFHVLGDDGPLALSGLTQAQNVFWGNCVRTLDNIRPVDSRELIG